MQSKNVDVIIPTYKPDAEFERLLQMLQKQTYRIGQILVINTEERYWNSTWEEKYPLLHVIHISGQEFDHGGTRKKAALVSTAGIMLYMTQDAVPADELLIENLIDALYEREDIAAAYARQLPKADCGFLERYTRSFNYPEQSSVKYRTDLERYGIKTYFCSNVCAAYKKEIYEKTGGFVERTLFNEDMIYAAKLIGSGYGVAYAANARVYHSHNYSAWQQLRRNFDLGVSQADHPEIFQEVPSVGEGLSLVKKSIAYLWKNGRWDLFFSLFLHSGCKYLGYLAGKNYKKLPRTWILKLTMMPSYWKSDV